jgi:hypothetical protein
METVDLAVAVYDVVVAAPSVGVAAPSVGVAAAVAWKSVHAFLRVAASAASNVAVVVGVGSVAIVAKGIHYWDWSCRCCFDDSLLLWRAWNHPAVDEHDEDGVGSAGSLYWDADLRDGEVEVVLVVHADADRRYH